MPDGDEQLAGNGDNGLVASQARLEASELGLPVGMGVDGGPGGLDHNSAQVAPAFFSNATGAMGLATVVDAGAQTGIADQLLVALETGDVADGGQDGQADDQAEAGLLHQQRDALVLGGDGSESGSQALNLLLGEGQGGQVGLDQGALGGAYRQTEPPIAVVRGEGGAFGGQRQVVSMQHGVQAVLGLGREPGELGPLGQRRPQLADSVWRHPDRG